MPAGGHSSFFPVPAAHGTTEAADGIMIAVFPFKEAFCHFGNGMSHERDFKQRSLVLNPSVSFGLTKVLYFVYCFGLELTVYLDSGRT